MKTRSKYNAKKVEIDGYVFDSKEEARYYEMLKRDVLDGKVASFELHPKFSLIDNYVYMGNKKRGITYEADFKVVYPNEWVEIVDIKGMSTQQGIMRRKMFEHRYPDLSLVWLASSIKYGDENGWIDYDELQKIRRKNKKEKYG